MPPSRGLRPGRLLSVPPHLRLTSEQTGSVGLTGGERERLARKGEGEQRCLWVLSHLLCLVWL